VAPQADPDTRLADQIASTEATISLQPVPTSSDTFQAKVAALLDLPHQGPDAEAEAVRRGTVSVRLPRAPRGTPRRTPANGLACTPRQGSFLLYCQEHGQFQKGSSKVRAELHRLGLTDSDATDAHLTDAGRAACEALQAAGVTPGSWQVRR